MLWLFQPLIFCLFLVFIRSLGQLIASQFFFHHQILRITITHFALHHVYQNFQIESLLDTIAVRYALPTIEEAPLPDMLRNAHLESKWQTKLMDLVAHRSGDDARQSVVLGERSWYRRNWRLFGDKSTSTEWRRDSSTIRLMYNRCDHVLWLLLSQITPTHSGVCWNAQLKSLLFSKYSEKINWKKARVWEACMRHFFIWEVSYRCQAIHPIWAKENLVACCEKCFASSSIGKNAALLDGTHMYSVSYRHAKQSCSVSVAPCVYISRSHNLLSFPFHQVWSLLHLNEVELSPALSTTLFNP